MPIGAMCTRLWVQIKFTEIERMLFSNIFQWWIHVLDKEGDAGGSPPPLPQHVFVILPTLFVSCIINKCSRPIQRYTAKTSHVRLPTHLDD